jgi:hypothetical protein
MCWWIRVGVFTLYCSGVASTSNALPDEGVTDCIETCRSCFSVTFNANFSIVFKTTHLCISWGIERLCDIEMDGVYLGNMECVRQTVSVYSKCSGLYRLREIYATEL